MRKITLILILSLGSMLAMAQEVMKVHLKNGTVTEIKLTEIEKITYSVSGVLDNGNTVTDIDGNVYNTVKIGDQVWMAENLKVTKFRDGTRITNPADKSSWCSQTTAAYCWPENNENVNKNLYGAFYNYFAVETNKLCPAGWHVPTNDEWRVLFNYLGGNTVAGGKMKETGTVNWYPPNSGATNESGFTARPAGYRNTQSASMDFVSMTTYAYWWSASRMVYYVSNGKPAVEGTIHAGDNLKNGYSVRCVKD
jgi:uncharacterized protein (TIGR02145 family)